LIDPRKVDVGYADMVGDLLHWGHIQFLRNCRSVCDYLVIGVDNDELVTRYKREPIIPYEKRIDVIRSIRYVDEARDSLSWNPADMMKQLVSEGYNLKYYFHGNDRVDPRSVAYIKSIGGTAVITPYIDGISTTYIINRIMARKEDR
jgi:glycerol-3-phosphate cytidylyltransferase